MNRRSLLTFLTLIALWTVMSEINHYLATSHLYLFVGALFVTLAALRLSPREGFFATILGGLLCDANAPVPFGTHIFLFAITHAIIVKIRARIAPEQTATQVIVAFVANLVLYTALSLVLAFGAFRLGAALPRLAWDLFLSQLFLLLIAPWFFALQTALLGLNPYSHHRRRY